MSDHEKNEKQADRRIAFVERRFIDQRKDRQCPRINRTVRDVCSSLSDVLKINSHIDLLETSLTSPDCAPQKVGGKIKKSKIEDIIRFLKTARDDHLTLISRCICTDRPRPGSEGEI